MSGPMATYVGPAGPEAPTRVSEATYEALRALGAPYGWEPMVSEPEPGLYRAWIRNTGDGRRMFGRWRATAEEAARDLLETKVMPWVRR